MIHPTAIIHPKADLQAGVEVGPYCVIDAHVRIGPGTRLFHNVYVTGWTEIGERCVLHPGVIVGHEPQDTKYKGERSFCTVGDGTILREYVTIHRGTTPESKTVVGRDCFLLAGSHVAHNCIVGDRVTLINNVLLAGHVEVGEAATLGGGAGIHQFVRIGERTMIAGNSRVILDVPPFVLADVEGRVAALNRVGLRRAEFSPEHREAIRNAFRTLYGKSLPFSTALLQLAEEVSELGAIDSRHPCKRLLDFLQAPSKRGIAGRTRRAVTE